MKNAFRRALSSLLVVVGVTRILGAPIPAIPLAQLVDQSDVIVAGTMTSRVDSGPALATTAGDEVVAGRRMIGHLAVEHVLKGPSGLDSLQFQFVVPDRQVGYAIVPEGSYRVFLLQRSEGSYVLASPYTPTLPAVHAVSSQGENPLERVIIGLAAVLQTPFADGSSKQEAIWHLRDLKHSAALAGLRTALVDADQGIQLSAGAALLRLNDLTALPMAEAALLHPTLPSESLHNLRVGIREGLRDPAAVPALARLVDGADPETKRAASFALGNTASAEVIPALVRALDDPDFQVRFNAVAGLARINGYAVPLLAQFGADEERYLRQWRDWSRTR